jgi:hypothetical protein
MPTYFERCRGEGAIQNCPEHVNYMNNIETIEGARDFI